MDRKIYKTDNGYTDNGSPLGCTMFWDEYGTYLGQEQINCFDDGPPILFFKAVGNEEPVKYALTEEEMKSAIKRSI